MQRTFKVQVQEHVDDVLRRYGSLDAKVTLQLAGNEEKTIKHGEFAKFSRISSGGQIGIGKWGNRTWIFDIKAEELYELTRGFDGNPQAVRVNIAGRAKSNVEELLYGSNFGEQIASSDFNDDNEDTSEGVESRKLSPDDTTELLERLESDGINSLDYLVLTSAENK